MSHICVSQPRNCDEQLTTDLKPIHLCSGMRWQNSKVKEQGWFFFPDCRGGSGWKEDKIL